MTVSVIPFFIDITFTSLETSCKISLSLETIKVSLNLFGAALASVAIISSAS